MPVLTVKDVWPDAKRIFATDDTTTLFRYLNDAVELLANAGQWDPLTGYLDACVVDRCVTLPTEVETPMQVSLNGVPAVGRDQFFTFHMNGPGQSWSPCRWSWMDEGDHPVYRDLVRPSKLVCFLDKAEDQGKELWVHGFDHLGAALRTKNDDGAFSDGILVPTIFGLPMPDHDAPLVRRITRVRKAPMVGRSRLSTREFSGDASTNQGVLLGVYQWDDLEPRFRRIRISGNASWARILFRRRTRTLSTQEDMIFLSTRLALMLGMQAVKAYVDRDTPSGNEFESNAIRMLSNEQLSVTPPIGAAMQFDDTSMRVADPLD